jgi:cytochrome c biogenesis protein CcdA
MTPLASGANALSAHLQGHTLSSALMLGALLGLVWSPCSGPLLASALILAASEHGGWSGAVVLGDARAQATRTQLGAMRGNT